MSCALTHVVERILAWTTKFRAGAMAGVEEVINDTINTQDERGVCAESSTEVKHASRDATARSVQPLSELACDVFPLSEKLCGLKTDVDSVAADANATEAEASILSPGREHLAVVARKGPKTGVADCDLAVAAFKDNLSMHRGARMGATALPALANDVAGV